METIDEIEITTEGSVTAPNLTPDPVYSDSYLDNQMRKAQPAWESVTDPGSWLEELRGGTVHS